MEDTLLVSTKKLNACHIRMARVGVNLSIGELAELADMNKATIVRIEAGESVRDTSAQPDYETH